LTECDVTMTAGTPDPVQATTTTEVVRMTASGVAPTVVHVAGIGAVPILTPEVGVLRVGTIDPAPSELEVARLRSAGIRTESMGLSLLERQKLASVTWGARNQAPDYVKLAYASEYSTGGGGEAGGGVGDSTQWVGTTSYQEVIQFGVLEPSMRGNGFLEITATMVFTNGDGDPNATVSFQLQRAADMPDEEGVDPSLFGLPQSFAAATTLQSLGIPNGVGVASGRLSLCFRVYALGHDSSSFRQLMDGRMKWTNLGGGDPQVREYLTPMLVDVSNDVVFRLAFKADQTVTAQQLWKVTSASAALVLPRDGHGY
jgi:hypothetical protein